MTNSPIFGAVHIACRAVVVFVAYTRTSAVWTCVQLCLVSFIYFSFIWYILLIYSRSESVKNTIKSEHCSYLLNRILSILNSTLSAATHDFILNAKLSIYLSLVLYFFFVCACMAIECARYHVSVCFLIFCSFFFSQETNIRSAIIFMAFAIYF